MTDEKISSAKILVVDDEPDLEQIVRQKFRRKIREGAVEFFFAHNGLEALDLLSSNGEIEVVLTDINMPRMDGLTLLEKIKEGDFQLKSVIVSAYGDMQNIRTAMNRGAIDFLMKPIDLQDLEITIDKSIREIQVLKQALHARDELVAVQRELNIARNIQQSSLPGVFPPFPDRKDFDIYAAMIPAREVGGDFYDFFLIDAQQLGVVIGDVSGKGVPAALQMAMSRTLLKAIALNGETPDQCLFHANNILSEEHHKGTFVTVFYAILNTDSGDLHYANGGHNLPHIIDSSGGIRELAKTGNLALGLKKQMAYTVHKSTLQPGETLFLHTDGVTEAMDAANKEYTDARLRQLLTAGKGSTPRELVGSVVEDVRNFTGGQPQSDDITALALRYTPK